MVTELQDNEKFNAGPALTKEAVSRRAAIYENSSEILRSISMTGIRLGQDPAVTTLWTTSFSTVANATGAWNGITAWLHMRRYPALLMLYSNGIAALAANRCEITKAILTAPIRSPSNQADEFPAAIEVHPWAVMENEVAKLLPDKERQRTPLSDHLYEVLRPRFMQEVFVFERDFDAWFDRFEFLLAAVHIHIAGKGQGHYWCPVGRFGWKYRIVQDGPDTFWADDLKKGPHGMLLPAGFFGGLSDQAKIAFESVSKIASDLHWS